MYKDEEGVQTVRNLANNMAFLMKAIADKKDELEPMKKEVFFNFVR